MATGFSLLITISLSLQNAHIKFIMNILLQSIKPLSSMKELLAMQIELCFAHTGVLL